MPTEMRMLPLLESVPHLGRFRPKPEPCSLGFDGHDWAQLTFNETLIAIRCQKCAHEPLDIMGYWVLGELGAR